MKLLITILLITLSSSYISAAPLDQLAQRIVNQAYRLQQSIKDYQFGAIGPGKIRQNANQIRHTLHQIDENLGLRPDTVSLTASCNLDVGGNFFNP